MRLSRGEVVFLVCIIVISWIMLPMVRSAGSEHTMVMESKKSASGSTEPLLALNDLANKEGITITSWSVLWKDSLKVHEEEQLLSWLQENEEFILTDTQRLQTPQQMELIKQVWESHRNNTVHQIEIISYPHKSKEQSNAMYTWSGSELPKDWTGEKKKIESLLSSIFQIVPQNFSLLEGFTNGKLNFDLSTNHIFQDWVNTLDGEMMTEIRDNNFFSFNGYIPTWEERVVTYGDKQMNLQLSARYNALDEQTRVTIGYPLILTEH